MVLKEGALKDTENSFLGACLGHGVYIGSGCVVSPGRAVSKNLRIIPNIERRIRSLRSSENIPGFELIKAQDKH
jgi:tetrahydrodipicolinate N-succinyltransferase